VIAVRAGRSPWKGIGILGVPLAVALSLLWTASASPPENHADWGDPDDTVTLTAVGDIMIQNRLRSFAKSDGGYERQFGQVAPILRGSDLVFGNLEGPVAPLTGEPQVSYVFNVDPAALTALKSVGFTIVSIANNHLHDQGSAGVRETLHQLALAGLGAVGVRSQPDSAPRHDVTVGDLRFAFLAYTTLTNRAVRGRQYPRVALWDSARSPAEIASARADSDFVLVSMHWGDEYAVEANGVQEELAQAICDAGADVVLGHHPHTLQPIRRVAVGDRPCLVAYSLGNFVSNMSAGYSERSPTATGDPRDSIALRVVFRSGATPQASFVPLWMANGPHFKGVIPLETLCRLAADKLESLNDFLPVLRLVRLRASRIAGVLTDDAAGLSPAHPCVTSLAMTSAE
jgi:poly-gamma-glutamate synthesis protein (capsule biosynthesis protein)